jgi:integrase
MAKELTALAIEKVKPGTARREIPDGRISGLYFIVQPNGKRSWAVRYRLSGKPCKFTLGKYPELDLKAAREKAGEIKSKVEHGKDPSAEKKASKVDTLPNDFIEDVAARFIVHHVRRKMKGNTAREVERVLNKEIVKPWAGRRLSQIGKSDVHAILDQIVERGSPIVANRVLGWLRCFCSWAVERDIIAANPCDRIKPPATETARDRVLSDDELKSTWKAADALEPPYGAFIKLLILTGARRTEIAEMQWTEIDFDARVWTLPKERSKNKREHTVPLSDPAFEILKAVPRVACSEIVFTLNGRNRITAFSLTKHRLDELMPSIPHWTLHDLRRTFASGCARLGVAVHVVEAALNHRSGTIKGVAAVYNRHDYAVEKRAALDMWARHVEMLMTGAAPNVIELRRGA